MRLSHKPCCERGFVVRGGSDASARTPDRR